MKTDKEKKEATTVPVDLTAVELKFIRALLDYWHSTEYGLIPKADEMASMGRTHIGQKLLIGLGRLTTIGSSK